MSKSLQLAKNGRKKRHRRCKVPVLLGGPQRRAIIYKFVIMNPRKPNSAKRKIAKVQIMGEVSLKDDGLRTFAKIPGEGKHGLNEFNVVLLEGKGPNDTPGVNYSLIRGVEDFLYLEEDRRQKRSKYGIKRPRSEIAIKKQKRVRGRFIKEGPVKFY